MKSLQGRQARVCCICSVPVRLPWGAGRGPLGRRSSDAVSGCRSVVLVPHSRCPSFTGQMDSVEGMAIGVLDRAVRSMAKTMLSNRAPKNFRSR